MIIYPFPVIRGVKPNKPIPKTITKKELKNQIKQLFEKYKINKHE